MNFNVTKAENIADFTEEAMENIFESTLDAEAIADDVSAVRRGEKSAELLLAECLDGADPDREQGWRDYVAAIVAAASA